MNSQTLDFTSIVALQHIADLHREAAQRRLARTARQVRNHRRKALGIRLQRAPAH